MPSLQQALARFFTEDLGDPSTSSKSPGMSINISKLRNVKALFFEFEDLLRVEMRGDNLRAFVTDLGFRNMLLKEVASKRYPGSFAPTSIK